MIVYWSLHSIFHWCDFDGLSIVRHNIWCNRLFLFFCFLTILFILYFVRLKVSRFDCFHELDVKSYLHTSETSKMKLFAKIFHGWKSLSVFSEMSSLDVWLDFEYTYKALSSVVRQNSESQNGFFKKTKHAKFSEKRICLTP